MNKKFMHFNKNKQEIQELIQKKPILPMLTLRDNILILPFLGIDLDLNAQIAKQLELAAFDNGGYFVLATKHNPLNPSNSISNYSRVVTLCHITKLIPIDQYNYRLSYNPEYKFSISEIIVDESNMSFCKGIIHNETITDQSEFQKEYDRAFSNLQKFLFAIYPDQAAEIITKIKPDPSDEPNPSLLIAIILSYVSQYNAVSNSFKQNILNELNPTSNLKMLNKLIDTALADSSKIEKDNLDKSVNQKVNDKLRQQQTEFMIKERINELNNQLKEIKGTPDEDNPIEEFKTKIEAIQATDEIKHSLNKEFKRLKNLQPSSSEYHVVENWISTVLSFPFSNQSKSKFDITKTRNILNQDHYGIDHVKKRMIQYLAVSHLNKKPNGQIICLFGPPGVGKTSVCKSIAKSLNREYIRISLGGMSDEAEIRGHRKTYIGAMPGKIIQELIKCKTNNPVIVLDEIDKISKVMNKGSVEAALLEVLDPEQNKEFSDHFMGVKIDLSKIIFIATANDISQVSSPLLDRMELIEMDSYTPHEKMQIAIKYLVPQEKIKAGLNKVKVDITESALESLINNYTREAGVRTLRKKISAIFRTCAEQFLDGVKSFEVTKENLTTFIDDDFYEKEKRKETMLSGTATGLAWTPVGGSILFVEASKMVGSGQIKLTGQLGDVMKESAQIAYSYIREHASDLNVSINKEEDIHIHFPAGATPKDGPSAGVTLVTTLVSLLRSKPMKPTVAMTGEISLKGEVLPVGGIKEKLIAAYTAGINEVIIPKENEKDIKKLPEEIRDSSTFIIHTVSSIDDVIRLAFD